MGMCYQPKLYLELSWILPCMDKAESVFRPAAWAAVALYYFFFNPSTIRFSPRRWSGDMERIKGWRRMDTGWIQDAACLPEAGMQPGQFERFSKSPYCTQITIDVFKTKGIGAIGEVFYIHVTRRRILGGTPIDWTRRWLWPSRARVKWPPLFIDC